MKVTIMTRDGNMMSVDLEDIFNLRKGDRIIKAVAWDPDVVGDEPTFNGHRKESGDY